MIRLYGLTHNQSSLVRVAQGAREGLEACGALAGFYDLDEVSQSDSFAVGYDASTAVCFGPPPAASVMLGRGEHRERLQFIAANSTWLPRELIFRLKRSATGLVAPSRWAVGVLQSHYDLPIKLWQHGVDAGFSPSGEPSGDFRVLHMASTHAERKGTRELIWGWMAALERKLIPPRSELRLVVDGPRDYFLSTICKASKGRVEAADTVDQLMRLDLPVDELRQFYSRFHLVAQPSRGEGFGLVPLEARACGVPVLATACTGHADHMAEGDPGVVVVSHGKEDLADDGPGALLPTVEVEAVVEGLGKAYANIRELREQALRAAATVQARWSWEAVTRAFLEQKCRLGSHSGSSCEKRNGHHEEQPIH